MKITKVDVRKYDNETNMKALVSMTIDDCFIVKGIRVIEGKDGLFVAMPSRKAGDTYKDIAHPLNSETRTMVNDAILKAYEEAE